MLSHTFTSLRKEGDTVIDTMNWVDPVLNEAYLVEKGLARGGCTGNVWNEAISFHQQGQRPR